MHAQPHRCLRRGVQAATLLAAALCLTACGAATSSDRGRATPGASPTATPTALAQALSRLDRLVVLRSDAFPQNHISFSFPAKVTVSDPLEVQAVARALLALPAMPSTAFNAPIDLGITYRLVFATADERLPPISVDATGAQVVRGLGGTRWVARSPGFWRTLGTAMGLARPEYATFRGSMPIA
jgi:hypothetical protein